MAMPGTGLDPGTGHFDFQDLPMAKTLIAPPLAGIRGTVGGLTFSANQAGTYVKLWASPANPQSELQMIQRSYVAQIPEMWRSLTPVARALWDTFAALGAQALIDSLGQTYYISGYLWFLKCNVRLMRVGRAPQLSVPVTARPAAPTINDFRVAAVGTETDLCVGGTPSASSAQPGYPASNAFDDVLTNWWAGTATGPPQWLEYQLAATAVVREYTLWIQYPGYGGNPVDWTFEAWNGAGWDILDTQVAVVMPTQAWYSFPFDNETTYTRYRINVSAIRNPPTNYVLIFEMAMYPGILGRSAIAYPSDSFVAPQTDLILHIAMTLSEAKIVEYPGYYEVLAMQSPGLYVQGFQQQLTDVFGTILGGRRWFCRFYRQNITGIRSAPSTSATNTAV